MALKIVIMAMSLTYLAFGSKATEPETKIQFSIYDLIQGKPNSGSTQLSKTYVKSVLAKLQEHRKDLMSCAKNEDGLSAIFGLRINQAGAAKVEIKSTIQAEDCVVNVLNRLEYPKHKFTGTVELEVPLEIRKQIL